LEREGDRLEGEVTAMARRVPPAEVTRWDNTAPDSHPTRSAYQFDQNFGWLEGAKTTTGSPRGGSWVQIGDASPVGARLFEAVNFQTGDQGRSRGRRRPEYGR
jgi:hypothetical protein